MSRYMPPARSIKRSPFTKPMAYYHDLAKRVNYPDFYHAASAILNIRLTVVRKHLSLEDVDYIVNKLHYFAKQNPPLFEVDNG
jgi:hypothetical protein